MKSLEEKNDGFVRPSSLIPIVRKHNINSLILNTESHEFSMLNINAIIFYCRWRGKLKR